MSKRNPWFKARTVWAFTEPDGSTGVCRSQFNGTDIRVRITDARELTAEKAVERLCQYEFVTMADIGGPNENIEFGVECAELMAARVGMTARVVNGKMRVRNIKQENQT
jgi:predicted transcriptional regulator